MFTPRRVAGGHSRAIIAAAMIDSRNAAVFSGRSELLNPYTTPLWRSRLLADRTRHALLPKSEDPRDEKQMVAWGLQ